VGALLVSFGAGQKILARQEEAERNSTKLQENPATATAKHLFVRRKPNENSNKKSTPTAYAVGA